MLVGEKYRKYVENVSDSMGTSARLVVVDVDEMVQKKIVRKQLIIRRKILKKE